MKVESESFEERSRAAHCHPESDLPRKFVRCSSKPVIGRAGALKGGGHLRENGPELIWPADSTAGEILKRAGLVKRRVKHQHVSAVQ